MVTGSYWGVNTALSSDVLCFWRLSINQINCWSIRLSYKPVFSINKDDLISIIKWVTRSVGNHFKLYILQKYRDKWLYEFFERIKRQKMEGVLYYLAKKQGFSQVQKRYLSYADRAGQYLNTLYLNTVFKYIYCIYTLYLNTFFNLYLITVFKYFWSVFKYMYLNTFLNTPFNISFLTIFYLLEAIIAILTQ